MIAVILNTRRLPDGGEDARNVSERANALIQYNLSVPVLIVDDSIRELQYASGYGVRCEPLVRRRDLTNL